MRQDCDSLLTTPSTGRDLSKYVLSSDPPAHLMAILRYCDALLIYNVAEQSLMTVAPGYEDWCAANGHKHLNNPAFGEEVKRMFPNVKLSGREVATESGSIRGFASPWMHPPPS